MLADGKILEHRKVQIRQPGSEQDIPSAVSIVPAGGHERGRVEPPLQRPLTGIEIAVREAVRPPVAARAAIVNGRHALRRMHGEAGLQTQRAIHLPSAQ